MTQAHQGLHRCRPLRSQREEQLRFESNVGQFIGDEHTAEDRQTPAIRGCFECSIIDDPDQLGADEYIYIELQTRESSEQTKHPIGPVCALECNLVILHERPEQRRVALFLANEKFSDPHERGNALSVREALCGPQEGRSLRLFPQLERCDRARDEPPLIGLQNIGKAVWQATRMPRVVFEVIQPNLEIHGKHAPPPDCHWRHQHASRFGHRCGGIRANSDARMSRDLA